MPLISSLLEPEILSKVSRLMTVWDAPESTNAKNSVVPARTLTVGRDLHDGSPFILLICPAICWRLQRLGNWIGALFPGNATAAPTQNPTRLMTDILYNDKKQLRLHLPVAAMPAAVMSVAAEETVCSAAKFLLDCFGAARPLALSAATLSSFACSLPSCIVSPCARDSCTPCKHPSSCDEGRPRTGT